MKHTKPYVLVGIGGIGMSALAHILLQEKAQVIGIDSVRSSITDELSAGGACVYIGEELDLDKQSHLVVSSAIAQDHPVIQQANKKQIPIWHRSELLRRLMEGKKVVAVAGTHGKTSTSGLLAFLLGELGADPSYAVGGLFNDERVHGKSGKGNLFVIEADESDGSFLNYTADGAIITNLESDHLDYWGTEQKLIQGFEQFVSTMSGKMPVFYCSSDPGLKQLSMKDGVSYGSDESADLKLLDIKNWENGQLFSFSYKGRVYKDFFLPLIGKYQVLNALPCLGLLLELGFSCSLIGEKLKSFPGIKKRLQFLKVKNGVTFFSDYAHHPTATKKTLQAVAEHYPGRKITCIFQPHRFSRMPLFLRCVKSPFSTINRCILFDVFSAGESYVKNEGKRLFHALEKWGHQERVFCKELVDFVQADIQFEPEEIVILMGAGNVHNWIEEVVAKA
ncbi:UDP-N-acetylmuramate--L-alanine ligase [Candidatus Aerophobetes bacterium]|uniref:UDP-N-acetylmuramate--L-alanine ligase n=1 Tax=Aerophobetes bacterium TaxID=2030807 RepID=A0A2A4X2H7_UNCAE|nr:MAG: UDP-N-acetylmuramate--L-alanine ligase [Candidatus Aerophobetes bacterium]